MEDHSHEVDRNLTSMFAPDALLPSQYFDRIRSHGKQSGERNLLVAVLEDALHVYRKNVGARDPRNRQLFLEAEEWIEERDPSRFLSFESVCDILGIDPEYIRRGVRGWKCRETDEAEPATEPQVVEHVEERRRAS